MSRWYLSYDGKQMGPMETEPAIQQILRNSNGYAWREGFAAWVLISQIPELQAPAMPTMTPPSFGNRGQADEIDYKILGSEMQFVEIELDPAVRDFFSLCFKCRGKYGFNHFRFQDWREECYGPHPSAAAVPKKALCREPWET